MKVYTKTGDNGVTSLIGGKRVAKNHPRLEAYGTVDELMSHTALLMDMIESESDKQFLSWTLERLMVLSAMLATDENPTKKIPVLTTDDVHRIEQKIDEMEGLLEPLRSFVLPGGHPAVSQCHVARTVCRRAERVIVALEQEHETPPVANELINRLSDYFFVLSRKLAEDLHVKQKKWMPFADV
ncbi:MAG: cob(I)yrinic acid a,c-diamide adenosyltransferase [Bacteroidales bacterium]|jgi:cob(I)alamin adenosyltransferase|nr:cob(I)yrinic acid a,c-diamide adenosyltransferase [Bacteroidales bacterium]